MKRALVGLGLLVAVVIAALVVLPSLVPADKIKEQVVQQVKKATGRDLTVDGKVSVSLFPSLAVSVEKLALASPPGFQSKDFLRVGALDIRLKVLPLLSGKVMVDSFQLTDPTIALEVDRQGRASWAFAPPAAPSERSEARRAEDGRAGFSDIRLAEGIRVTNGKLTYSDERSRSQEAVEDVNLILLSKSLDDPLAAKGDFHWHGQPVALAVDLGKPRALVDGSGSSPLAVNIATEAARLSLSAEMNGADNSLAGLLDLSVPSVRKLLAWASGKAPDMPSGGLGPLGVKGKLTAGGSRVGFTQAAIALDNIKGAGNFSVDTGGAKPVIKASLEIENLDLTPYLPPEAASAGDSKPGGPAAPARDWSDEPIDASALNAAEADAALTLGALKVRKIQLGRSKVTAALHGGKLTAALAELALYQGQGQGRLALDGSGRGVGLEAAFTLKGVQAAPFLNDAAGFDRIEGTGNFDGQVAGRGATERQIVGSLGGKGAVTFLDGAIRGINLAAMMRNLTSAFSDTSGTQKTDFAELSGSYSITSGVVANKDLILKSPLLRVAGSGTVDLPKRSVSYRVEPKVVPSIEGQGGKDLAGLTVPVIVEGPWSSLSFRPDLAAAVQGKAGEAVKGLMGGALPGQKAGAPSPLPIDPGKLFGR